MWSEMSTQKGPRASDVKSLDSCVTVTAVVAPTPRDDVDFEQIMCDGDCGKELPSNHYPKGDVWGDNPNPKMYCPSCWDKQRRAMVTTEIEDEAEREKVLTSTDDGLPSRKRRRLASCKWCGSTSHKTKRSRQCPHNPRHKSKNVEKTQSPQQDKSNDNGEQLDNDEVTPQRTSAPPPVTPPELHSFSAGDNALYKNDKETRLVQVVATRGENKYEIYLVDDGSSQTVHASKLKPERYPTPLRHEYLNLEWYFDGADDLESGRWKVRRIVGNEFVCTRLTGGTACSQNRENFDIGYVMNQIHTQHEFHRNRRRFRCR